MTEAPGETQTPGTPEAAASPARVLASEYNSNRAFADFPISPEVLKGLTELGYAMATPIQAASIEPALAGKDLVLRAKTGTGKTAAFGIPIVEKVLAGDRRTRAVVLAPTRELALQIAQEVAGIARFKDLRVAAIYGGVGFGPQEQALRDGAEIVVGTPGRMLDHIKRGNLKLGEVSFAVLDEADEMLSMGFLEDVRKILDRTPDSRQTLLCSATIDEGMKSLVARYLKEPEEILLSADGDNVSTVTHILYETSPDYHKARALSDLLEQERPGSAIIFCNTREDVSTVYTYLDRQGFRAEMITGDLPQTRRERVMAKIKAGKVQFLVATDVAARGIDISDLTHVINYSLPDDAAVYLHRIGRTGRIGKTGTAITLAGGADFSTRITLERQHRLKFDVKQLPTTEELGRLRGERLGRVIKEASGSVAYESYVEAARGLKDRPDADVLIATMLKVYFQWEHARRAAEEEEATSPEGGTSERREEGRERRDEGRSERRDRGDRPRDDRPRDDRPRDDRRDRNDRSRDDRPREDRSERRRDDRPREDRPREDRREDRPRAEAPRTEEPARPVEGAESLPAAEKPAEAAAEPRRRRERRPDDKREERKERSSTEAAAEPAEAELVPATAEDSGVDGDEGSESEESGEEGSGAAGTKRRRRRRRRSGPRPDATPAT